ncbi:MAG: tetratricopeptide repeat protein [Hyphomicrobiales bacterium]
MSDESIFREVDEEVRAEHAKKIWEKYGAYAMGLCIGVVLAVAGIKGWQAWAVYKNEQAGEQYVTALNLVRDGKAAEAEAAFAEIAKNGPDGYASLARFQQAAALVQKGDGSGAVKVYDQIAASSSIDQALRDLARMRAGLILVDTAPMAEIEKRMAGLNTEKGAWRHSAREVIGLAAYRTGNMQKANTLLSEILADPAAPASVRQRAQILLGVITPELGSKAKVTDTNSGGN